MNIDTKDEDLMVRHKPSNPQKVSHFQKQGILLFDNRRIRHLERMIDLFHTLFQKPR